MRKQSVACVLKRGEHWLFKTAENVDLPVLNDKINFENGVKSINHFFIVNLDILFQVSGFEHVFLFYFVR